TVGDIVLSAFFERDIVGDNANNVGLAFNFFRECLPESHFINHEEHKWSESLPEFHYIRPRAAFRRRRSMICADMRMRLEQFAYGFAQSPLSCSMHDSHTVEVG